MAGALIGIGGRVLGGLAGLLGRHWGKVAIGSYVGLQLAPETRTTIEGWIDSVRRRFGTPDPQTDLSPGGLLRAGAQASQDMILRQFVPKYDALMTFMRTGDVKPLVRSLLADVFTDEAMRSDLPERLANLAAEGKYSEFYTLFMQNLDKMDVTKIAAWAGSCVLAWWVASRFTDNWVLQLPATLFIGGFINDIVRGFTHRTPSPDARARAEMERGVTQARALVPTGVPVPEPEPS